jgi:UDP-N-acetylmuramoyl-tripeptide--D-alanyl-D-alanine ligase
VAIAGSNGKTTTKELVAAVLSKKFNVLKTTGNLNNLIGVPATMLRMSEQHTAAVVEIGTNTPGEIEKLCAILEPTHGVITNVGREHLELLGSLEGVAEEEGALFRYLAEHDGTAFINLDDAQIRRLAAGSQRKVSYSLSGAADVSAEIERLSELGTPVLRLESDRERAIVTLRLPGIHSATNALAATAIGLHFGLTLEEIRSVLEEFEPLQGSSGYARLAPVRAKNGALILNDTYNANPDSMLVAFNTLRAMPLPSGGRRIVVLGDMKELGTTSADEHRHLGEELGSDGSIAAAYFFGNDMNLAHGALDGTAVQSQTFRDKPELIQALLRDLTPNDLVLVKGSRSMKMEEVVAGLV